MIGKKKKCPLSEFTGVRINQVDFTENLRTFPEIKNVEASVLTGVRKAGFDCSLLPLIKHYFIKVIISVDVIQTF